MRYLLSVGAKLTDEYNCIDLVEIWAKYPTAIKLLILSRCCVLEKEHLLWHIPARTVGRYRGQVNYLNLEFFIWCFEELGFDIGDIYNILQTYIWNGRQLAELHEWMIIKMSVVPSLMAGCRKIIKNSLAQINDQVSIFPAIDQLPLPKLMKSFLKDDVYGANPFVFDDFSQESPKISKYAYGTENSFPFRDFGRSTAFPRKIKRTRPIQSRPPNSWNCGMYVPGNMIRFILEERENYGVRVCLRIGYNSSAKMRRELFQQIHPSLCSYTATMKDIFPTNCSSIKDRPEQTHLRIRSKQNYKYECKNFKNN